MTIYAVRYYMMYNMEGGAFLKCKRAYILVILVASMVISGNIKQYAFLLMCRIECGALHFSFLLSLIHVIIYPRMDNNVHYLILLEIIMILP